MTGTWPPWLDAPWSQCVSMRRDGRMPHAMLIAGVEGLGKRELTARLVARLLCESAAGDDACGSCRSCAWLSAGTHPDCLHIGPEEGSDIVKVDQIRDLIGRMQLTGQVDATRVAVIDPADAMNVAAQNAVLKTLEEPAMGVHLILVADAPARLLATVRSRCRTVTVSPPDTQTARAWLAGSGFDDGRALALAAGHPGRALDYAEPEHAKRLSAVAADLHRLLAAEETALAIAKRWSEDAASHIDDAAAWLRLWAWQAEGVVADASGGTAPSMSVHGLIHAYEDARRLRERLRAPLKSVWLLHEWLVAWRSAAVQHR